MKRVPLHFQIFIALVLAVVCGWLSGTTAHIGPLAFSVKARACEVYRLFDQNPDHPSLRFKKLQGRDDVWPVRINDQYRAVGVQTGDTIVWIWIGTHNEFDNLFA